MLNKYLKSDLQDKFKIKCGEYTESVKSSVRSDDPLPEIHLEGTRSNGTDSQMFEEISCQRGQTTKKLILRMMMIEKLENKPEIFPILEELIFNNCQIEDADLMRFNEWCPNVNTLVIYKSQLSKDAYDTFLSTDHAMTHVKSLAFDFCEGMMLSREFLAAIDKKFPSLENLNLVLGAADFGSNNLFYKPLYLKKLKNLSVDISLSTHQSEDVNKLFDLMAISNEQLKGLEFVGSTFHNKLMNWIEGCEKLNNLTLRCQKLSDSELIQMDEMPQLQNLNLEVEEFEWSSEKMLNFAQNHPQLKNIDAKLGKSIASKKLHDRVNSEILNYIGFFKVVHGSFSYKFKDLENGEEIEYCDKGYQYQKCK